MNLAVDVLERKDLARQMDKTQNACRTTSSPPVRPAERVILERLVCDAAFGDLFKLGVGVG